LYFTKEDRLKVFQQIKEKEVMAYQKDRWNFPKPFRKFVPISVSILGVIIFSILLLSNLNHDANPQTAQSPSPEVAPLDIQENEIQKLESQEIPIINKKEEEVYYSPDYDEIPINFDMPSYIPKGLKHIQGLGHIYEHESSNEVSVNKTHIWQDENSDIKDGINYLDIHDGKKQLQISKSKSSTQECGPYNVDNGEKIDIAGNNVWIEKIKMGKNKEIWQTDIDVCSDDGTSYLIRGYNIENEELIKVAKSIFNPIQ
jgi:hypothetical protein